MAFKLFPLLFVVAVANCGLLAPSPLIGSSLVGSPLVRSSVVGSPLVGPSLLGSPLGGQSLLGSPLVGQSLLGSPLVGQSLLGSSLVRSPLIGSSVYGSPLLGSSLLGSPLASSYGNIGGLSVARGALGPYSLGSSLSKVAIGASPILTKGVNVEYNAYPKYSFGYDIQDGLTGDVKNQQESRDGDVVVGSYSLIDADGKKRIVEYQADAVNGFNAVVNRIPLAQKVITSSPIVTKIASPSIWNGVGQSVWQ